MQVGGLLCASMGLWLVVGSARAVDPLDAYNVVWNSPSNDSSGSMPLGNGDIGLNLWVEEGGDLVFYISKTDAWDEYCRLVKVGRVRVSLWPNPFVKGQPFRQTLQLRQGTIEIAAGSGEGAVTLQVWVDANHPAIRIQAESRRPFEMRASVDQWRTQERTLTGREAGSAYGMDGGPVPIVVRPDALLPPQKECIAWCHRNESSIWSFTLKHQGLEEWIGQGQDPLLHRTFGGLIAGDGFESLGSALLQSTGPRGRHDLLVTVLTAQTQTPAAWHERVKELAEQVRRQPPDVARAAHLKWWDEFWNRSYIRVAPASQGQVHVQMAEEMAVNTLPLRIGADSDGRNAFAGDIDRVRVYGRALQLEEIQAHARDRHTQAPLEPALVGEWTFDEEERGGFPTRAGWGLSAWPKGEIKVVDQAGNKCLRLEGKGWVEVNADSRLDLTQAVTLEAWVRPLALPPGGARIIDKSQAGTSNGYLLDTCPGNSLRMIVKADTLIHPANLQSGQWAHVAATFDAKTGTQALYVNGKRVAGNDGSILDSKPDVSRAYALQRFISACAGRGAYPIKFNGSIFTVDSREPGEVYDADYRRWGGPYWFQNTRLAYWPMLASGDFEQMRPLFKMYREAMPFLKHRTREYFGHGGAYFPETMYFWGAYANSNYGWNREGKKPSEVTNTYIRRHFNGTLELLALMLDYHAYTQDAGFLETDLLPAADEFLAFWEQHWPREADGRLRFEPSQALETYQNAVNPAQDIAGLRWVLARLLEYADDQIGPQRRARWSKLLSEVPPLPTAEKDGRKVLAPAEKETGGRGNIENPELYAIFPFRLYGVGKPDLDLARHTFSQRIVKKNVGWHQDDTQAAFLGLVDEAARMVAVRFAKRHPGSRFPAFWGPNYDWIPDQDHGCNGLMALQTMLLQADGDKILLLPAWPKGWDVEFKLHAPKRTVVEGIYRGGKLEKLTVTPEARRTDVIVFADE